MRETPTVDVPKPKEFKGSRKAEDIDNFFWYIKRYFEAIQLDDSAKRRKHNEIQRGLCMINTWEAFLAELKK
ncbi:hypothetical protein QQ045_023577 [Rhodiola kirilowii]